MDTAANRNNKENQPGISGAGGGGGEQQNPAELEEGHNADNYNARQARKYTEKEQVDTFQERLLKAIETPQPQVDLAPPPPLEKHEYLDVSLEAMAFKMKEVLSKEEVIDVVKDLENLVSRTSREKRRQMEMVQNCSTTASPAGPDVCGSTSTHGSASAIQQQQCQQQ